MTEHSKTEYQNLINRSKLPENKELYDQYSLHSKSSKESAEIWDAMRKIHGTYEKNWGAIIACLKKSRFCTFSKKHISC